ncbi:hypothetical protein SK128_012093 [Halocaridina rubra]|uniref:Uncharacterized protein n=1 Tax=Halocaridina rubra TaxID=373956 RepID=A0AAN9A9W7_HALRR
MAAKFLQRPNATNSHNLITSTSSSGQVDGDVQEEFRRLYMQLEMLKEKNLRLGNRLLFAKIAAMQEAANTASTTSPTPATTVVVTEKKNNTEIGLAEKQQKPASRSERKYSDGIVMKPYVNNILANMTDKIVCATFKDDLSSPPLMNMATSPTEIKPSRECSGSLSTSTIGGSSKASSLGSGKASRASSQRPSKEDLKRIARESPTETPTPAHSDPVEKYDAREPLSCQCQSVSRENVNCIHHGPKCESDCKSNTSDKDMRSLGFRSAEFLGLRKSVSSEGTTDISERVCRSLENLDDSSARCGVDNEVNGEDRSVRSAHSTPRRNPGRFREVRDPERARAFILNNLSDRATLTEEVTV